MKKLILILCVACLTYFSANAAETEDEGQRYYFADGSSLLLPEDWSYGLNEGMPFILNGEDFAYIYNAQDLRRRMGIAHNDLINALNDYFTWAYGMELSPDFNQIQMAELRGRETLIYDYIDTYGDEAMVAIMRLNSGELSVMSALTFSGTLDRRDVMLNIFATYDNISRPQLVPGQFVFDDGQVITLSDGWTYEYDVTGSLLLRDNAGIASLLDWYEHAPMLADYDAQGAYDAIRANYRPTVAEATAATFTPADIITATVNGTTIHYVAFRVDDFERVLAVRLVSDTLTLYTDINLSGGRMGTPPDDLFGIVASAVPTAELIYPFGNTSLQASSLWDVRINSRSAIMRLTIDSAPVDLYNTEYLTQNNVSVLEVSQTVRDFYRARYGDSVPEGVALESLTFDGRAAAAYRFTAPATGRSAVIVAVQLAHGGIGLLLAEGLADVEAAVQIAAMWR